MNIIGLDFYFDESALDISPIMYDGDEITKFEVANAVYDGLYVTKNADMDDSELNTLWNNDTVLNAEYNEDIGGGNVSYTADETDFLRIKVRKEDEYEWSTLAEYTVITTDDLSISYTDRYRSSGEKLEYAVVPVTNDIEGNYSLANVTSKFDGIVIAEKDVTYRAFAYNEVDTTRNHAMAFITTLKGKYPYAVKNARTNYTTGSISAGFYPLFDGEIDLYKRTEIAKYREEFIDFMTDGLPKVLKLDDGRSWIVNINDSITAKGAGDAYYTEFSFTQTGDVNDSIDMYNADLIDAGADYKYVDGEYVATYISDNYIDISDIEAISDEELRAITGGK